MKPKTILLTLFVTGAILLAWHLLTPTQPAPTETISSEEILKEIRTNRKKRVGSLDSVTGSYQAMVLKAARRTTEPVPQEKTVVEEFLPLDTGVTDFLPVTAYWLEESSPQDQPVRPTYEYQWGSLSNDVLIGDRFALVFDHIVNWEGGTQDSGLISADLLILSLGEAALNGTDLEELLVEN